MNFTFFFHVKAEKCIADDEEEKVGIIAEEVSKKQKGSRFFLFCIHFAHLFLKKKTKKLLLFSQIARRIW